MKGTTVLSSDALVISVTLATVAVAMSVSIFTVAATMVVASTSTPSCTGGGGGGVFRFPGSDMIVCGSFKFSSSLFFVVTSQLLSLVGG